MPRETSSALLSSCRKHGVKLSLAGQADHQMSVSMIARDCMAVAYIMTAIRRCEASRRGINVALAERKEVKPT